MASPNLSVLLVDFVSNKHDGDVFTDPGETSIPFGNVLVGDSGGDVEHHNSSMGSDIIAFTKPSQLLLPGGVPEIELNGSPVGVEDDRVDIDTLSC